MVARFGIGEAYFSLKCFVAAMLAYYVALRLGLTKPFWAVMTAYIIANPMAGAVFSKAVFRIGGTLVGAGIAVFAVPILINYPEFMTLVFALWLGLCVYIALLDRTPRSYFFLLSGYTVCIIGFPSVWQPEFIFDTAALRVQEITLGILCATIVHSVFSTTTVTSALFHRMAATLMDAEQWTRDSLRLETQGQLTEDRRRLALDIGEMHQLSTHLPFDTARFMPRTRTLRALQDQLSMLLPLATGVEDRLMILAKGSGVPADVQALVDDVVAWLDDGPHNLDYGAAADALIARARVLEPAMGREVDFAALTLLSLLSRLAELISAHRNCRDLDSQMRSCSRAPASVSVAALLAGAGSRPLHRDHAMALRCGAASAAAVIITAALWILTEWKDGATAAMMAGIFCALFSAADPSSPLIRNMFLGNIYGFLVAMIYAFVIFPRVTDFTVLIAVLAPTLLAGGMLLSQRRHALMAIGTILGFFGAVGLSDHFDVNFSVLVNNGLASVIGPAIAVLAFHIFMTIGSDRSAKRLIRAGWKELADRSVSSAPLDKNAWASRMLDRIGLLVPRLSALRQDPGQPVMDALIDLRVGNAVAELQTMRFGTMADDDQILSAILQGVSAHYRALLQNKLSSADDSPLLSIIDTALRRMAQQEDGIIRRDTLLALMTLRRNLFPQSLCLEG